MESKFWGAYRVARAVQVNEGGSINFVSGVLSGFNRWMQHTRDCASSGVLQMKQRRRIYYAETQKALMWGRWQKGESLQHIAQLFDRNHSSIQRILAESVGIRPPPGGSWRSRAGDRLRGIEPVRHRLNDQRRRGRIDHVSRAAHRHSA